MDSEPPSDTSVGASGDKGGSSAGVGIGAVLTRRPERTRKTNKLWNFEERISEAETESGSDRR